MPNSETTDRWQQIEKIPRDMEGKKVWAWTKDLGVHVMTVPHKFSRDPRHCGEFYYRIFCAPAAPSLEELTVSNLPVKNPLSSIYARLTRACPQMSLREKLLHIAKCTDADPLDVAMEVMQEPANVTEGGELRLFKADDKFMILGKGNDNYIDAQTMWCGPCPFEWDKADGMDAWDGDWLISHPDADHTKTFKVFCIESFTLQIIHKGSPVGLIFKEIS